jgi:hypothetical protein
LSGGGSRGNVFKEKLKFEARDMNSSETNHIYEYIDIGMVFKQSSQKMTMIRVT